MTIHEKQYQWSLKKINRRCALLQEMYFVRRSTKYFKAKKINNTLSCKSNGREDALQFLTRDHAVFVLIFCVVQSCAESAQNELLHSCELRRKFGSAHTKGQACAELLIVIRV